MSINDVLTQEEVEALLSEVDAGAIGAGAAGAQGDTDVIPYNLSGKERIIRGPLPTLEMIYERFSRLFRSSLYTSLRREATVELSSVESLKFAEYSASVPANCGLHLAKIVPLPGTALFLLEPPLVHMLVDSFFGGGTRLFRNDESRELTITELRITRIIIQGLTKDFEQAWAPVLRVQLEHTESDTNIRFINIVSPTETVIVARFSVQFGPHGGEFHVVVPYSMIQPIRETLDAGTFSDRAEFDGRWTDHLRKGLQAVDLELRGTIVETEVLLKEVLAFNPGDVIAADFPAEVSLTVDGASLFHGTFGVARGHNAIKITQPPQSEMKSLLREAGMAADRQGTGGL